MFPMLADGVSYGTYRDKEFNSIRYFIANATGDEYDIDYRLLFSLLNADGTKPLMLHDQRIIPFLKKARLIQTSRFVRGEGLMNRFILFPVGGNANKLRSMCMVINNYLPVVSIGVFLISILKLVFGEHYTSYDFNLSLYYILFITSIALHELGHMIAGIACGHRICDVGILLLGILPLGAYVACIENKKSSRNNRTQFYLAGVEMSLLLAGILIILSILTGSFTLMTNANISVFLTILNLLPVTGLDGEAALSCMCGVESISAFANKWIFNKKLRSRLFHSGLAGYECLCIFTVVVISKIIFGIYIVFKITSLIWNFF